MSGSITGIVGLVAAFFLFLISVDVKDQLRRILKPLESLFAGKYYLDEIADVLVSAPIRCTSQIVTRAIENSIVDGTVSAVGKMSSVSGELVRRATTGQVATYILFMFLAVSVFVGLLVGR